MRHAVKAVIRFLSGLMCISCSIVLFYLIFIVLNVFFVASYVSRSNDFHEKFAKIPHASDINEALLMLGSPFKSDNGTYYQERFLVENFENFDGKTEYRYWANLDFYLSRYVYILGSNNNGKIIFKKRILIRK